MVISWILVFLAALSCLLWCSLKHRSWWHHQMETFAPLLALCVGQANSLHKGRWRQALMFSLICTWINGWVDQHEAVDLRCQSAHCDVTLMIISPTHGRPMRCLLWIWILIYVLQVLLLVVCSMIVNYHMILAVSYDNWLFCDRIWMYYMSHYSYS